MTIFSRGGPTNRWKFRLRGFEFVMFEPAEQAEDLVTGHSVVVFDDLWQAAVTPLSALTRPIADIGPR